jgi:hypothetical protein
MTVELINQTNNANIYGIYEKDGSPAGTVENILTGPNCGYHAYTISRHTRAEIMAAYKEYRRANK